MPSRLMILLGILLILISGCGGSEENDETGGLNQPCHSDNTCDGILKCMDNICQLPGEDGDIDIDPELDDTEEDLEDLTEQEPDNDYECYSSRDCDEDYICVSYVCVKEGVDGDDDLSEEDTTDAEENDSGPKLKINPDPVNFGSVPEGQSSKRMIYLTNIGEVNLQILDVLVEMDDINASYGKYELTAPVDNITLIPTETIGIEIKFTRKYENLGNDVQAYLAVDSTSITGDITRVRMFSSSSHLVNMAIDPAESIDFGDVPLGSTDSKVFKIMNPSLKADMGNLLIEKIEIAEGSKYFAIGTPTPTVPRTIEPDGSSMLIQIAAISQTDDQDGEDSQLDKTGKLAIYHNDPTKEYPYLVPIKLHIIFPELHFNPTELNFGAVAIGDTTSLMVTVRNNGGEAAVIEEINFATPFSGGDEDIEDNRDYFTVESNPPSIIQEGVEVLALGSLPANIPAAEKRIFRLDYNPRAFGDHNASIEVVSTDVAGENFVVSMKGQGIPPLLSILPNSLNFSPVQVGQVEERTVNISYNGSGEIIVKEADIAFDQVFKIVDPPEFPVTLTSSSDPVIIKVIYQPINQTAQDTATLTIVIGSEDTIDYEVPISGSAVSAQMLLEYNNSASLNDVQVLPESVPDMDSMTEDQKNIWLGRATATITNPGTAPLHISSIAPRLEDQDIFGVEAILPLTIQPSESATFDILFAPRDMANYYAKIIICSDATNPQGTAADCETDRHRSSFIEIAKIPTSIRMRLDLQKEYLEFDQPEPNGYTTKDLVITNLMSSSVVHIDNIEIVNPTGDEVFFIDNIVPAKGANGWDIENGVVDSITISLRFEPTEEGTKNGSLIIEHNDKDASLDGGVTFMYPKFAVPLVGHGLGNTPPIAIVKSPQNTPASLQGTYYRAVLRNEPVQIFGDSSYDLDRDTTSDAIDGYTWSFDQTSGFTWEENTTGSMITATFTENGNYNINLQVVDRYGDVSEPTPDSTIEIDVQENPVAIIKVEGEDYRSTSLNAYLRVPVNFDGTDSYDPDGEIVTYRWYFKQGYDGTMTLFSTEPKPSFTFPEATESSDAMIFLEVVDDDGRVSPEMDSKSFRVYGNDTLRIEAIWTNGGNVNIHYVAPNGSVGTSQDCNESNPEPNWGNYGTPKFTQSSSDGSRAEIISHENPADGTYLVEAQYVEAAQNCYQESVCFTHEEDCDFCGCSCWKPFCYLSTYITDCCKTCDECEWVTKCEDKPTTVKFYLYINNESEPLRVVEQNILEGGGTTNFNLTRTDGFFN